MTAYEELLEYAVNEGITVVDFELGDKTKGLYCDGVAFINKNCCTAEKFCTLAEELGHHYTASANIVSLSLSMDLIFSSYSAFNAAAASLSFDADSISFRILSVLLFKTFFTGSNNIPESKKKRIKIAIP